MSNSLAPYDAVIFDMDGVLIDTEQLYKQAMQSACRSFGVEMSDAFFMRQVGIASDMARELLRSEFGDSFPLDDYDRHVHDGMIALMADGVPIKPGVPEFLAALKDNDVPIAVATSTARPAALERLTRGGLISFFDHIVTRDDVSKPKPDPEPYLTAAQRLGMDPANCIAIEDSHNGVRSAHGAGMRVIMVPDLLTASEEIAALCHAVMDTMAHVHGSVLEDAARKKA